MMCYIDHIASLRYDDDDDGVLKKASCAVRK